MKFLSCFGSDLPVVIVFLSIICAASSQAGGPLSIPPSQDWDGIDGPWSTFWAQVGTPVQTVRLLPGTSADALWVPIPEGCTPQDPPTCTQSRTVFNYNGSSTWHEIGTYHLGLAQESLLGYDPNADNAIDANETFTLGLPGSGLPAVNNSVVEGIATKDFYMGLIGLNPQAINLTSITDPQPSILQSLKDSGSIPSVSWAYTAGSVNLGTTAYGSLTLGGYDTSRFVVNNLSIPFLADSSRDLVIGIQSIKTDAPNNRALLTDGISAFIDSLVPEFWLPQEVCTAFEQAFGLTWNEAESRYLLNDSAHNALMHLNPNVTFTLGAQPSGGDNINIVFPYTSFDLTAEPPLVSNKSSYFPLKRAQNSTQYTLGRAFFQNAYVIADYERSNFSVHQALVPSNTNTQNLIPILSTDSTGQPSQPSLTSQTNKSNSSGVSGGAIAGIVIGVLAVLVAAVGALLFYRRQKRKGRSEAQPKEDPYNPYVDTKAELDGTGAAAQQPVTLPQEQKHGFYAPDTPELDHETPGMVELAGAADLSSGMTSPAAELESDPNSPYKDAVTTQTREMGSQHFERSSEYPFPSHSSTFGSHEMDGADLGALAAVTGGTAQQSQDIDSLRNRPVDPEAGMSLETRSDLESLRDKQVSPDPTRTSQITDLGSLAGQHPGSEGGTTSQRAHDLESLRNQQVSPGVATPSEPGSDPDDFRGRRASPNLLYSPDASSFYFGPPSQHRGVSPYIGSTADTGTGPLSPLHLRQGSGDGTVTPTTRSDSPGLSREVHATRSNPET
ncbi:MAG: hypothetical protein Q9165_003181 [Trypethelium subeluteriae]